MVDRIVVELPDGLLAERFEHAPTKHVVDEAEMQTRIANDLGMPAKLRVDGVWRAAIATAEVKRRASIDDSLVETVTYEVTVLADDLADRWATWGTRSLKAVVSGKTVPTFSSHRVAKAEAQASAKAELKQRGADQ